MDYRLIAKKLKEEVMGSCIPLSRKGGEIYKDYMERSMNEENEWDHNEDGDEVMSSVDCVSREVGMQVLAEYVSPRWIRNVS